MNKKQLSANIFLISLLACSCGVKDQAPRADEIAAIALKTGPLVLCGPPDQKLGDVNFVVTAPDELKKQFNLGVALLHSFEYDESEKVFSGIISKDPECAMAYWGVAMSTYHPLWSPPEKTDLEKGSKALAIAVRLSDKTKKEGAYINALHAFYDGWQTVDYKTRCLRYNESMKQVHENYPDDTEASIFYALSLIAAADVTDTLYTKQKLAGDILNDVYRKQPNHPGIVHYIIHTYDYPALAKYGLDAARRYASVAPSSAHAQHMPSHIFVRLGLWDDCIQSNKQSIESAKCYAESMAIKGHWDEELHALDYLVYAYLQKGAFDSARREYQYLQSIDNVSPVNFKDAYTYAAVPARYVLETRNWKEATSLPLAPANFPWQKFPWQEAIVHFARVLGAVHTGNLAIAERELATMQELQRKLLNDQDAYKANQVDIQIKSSNAWIQWKKGNRTKALEDMKMAAEMEDKTSKHPVTPGEVLPARELLGDLLMEMHDYPEALTAYRANLQKHPNRYNGVKGEKEAGGHR